MTIKVGLLLWSVLAASEPAVTFPVVSEEISPMQEISAHTQDGHSAIAVLRRPPGKGPFPAVIYLHGGLKQRRIEDLKASIRGATLARFLAAGYVIVAPTFRSRVEDPQTQDALWDCKAIVEHVAKMPGIDPGSVVIWGTSGGGSLALELAGETRLAAIAADEPANILFTGILTKETNKGPEDKDRDIVMREPKRYYTPELQTYTRQKIARISCPVLIVQGGIHLINRINNEIFFPEMKQAAKNFEALIYPGEPHGVTNGAGSPEAARKFFDDASRFFARYLAVKPVSIQSRSVSYVPVPAKSR